MSKPTIHFAYTVPMGSTLLRRGIDKLIRVSNIIPPLHRLGSDALIPWQHPIRAPHSISYNLLHAFRAKGYPVRFYSILEKGAVPLKDGDIFIGQPIPEGGFNESRPSHDDVHSVTSATIRANPRAKTFLIMPYTHDSLYVSWAKDLVSQPMSGLICVGGDIWQRNWERSPFADLSIAKRTNAIMGIDSKDYPFIKKSFNQPGKRKYLYIGHTGWYKNTLQLEAIAQRIPGFEGGHLGSGTIRGWKKIADFAALTPTFMEEIAREYDIFVNVSTADAQATTILEQMCFGFIVAASYESGYDHPSIVQLSPHDTEFNVRALTALQNADESELFARAQENRATAVREHSWDQFCRTVTEFIGIQS